MSDDKTPPITLADEKALAVYYGLRRVGAVATLHLVNHTTQ